MMLLMTTLIIPLMMILKVMYNEDDEMGRDNIDNEDYDFMVDHKYDNIWWWYWW